VEFRSELFRHLDAFNLDAIMAPSGSPAWKTDHANGDKFTLGSSSPAAISGYPRITLLWVMWTSCLLAYPYLDVNGVKVN